MSVDVDQLVRTGDPVELARWLETTATLDIVDELTRLDPASTAIAFRLLPRERALQVFEALEPMASGT